MFLLYSDDVYTTGINASVFASWRCEKSRCAVVIVAKFVLSY